MRITIIETIRKRRDYFNQYFPQIKGIDYRKDIEISLQNTCPCCGYYTLPARCSWEICLICFWEDDGQDELDGDKIYGGPNGADSLTTYRVEFDRKSRLYKENNPDSALSIAFNDLDRLIREETRDVEQVQRQLNFILTEFSSLTTAIQRPW
jgi:hypothetical protein